MRPAGSVLVTVAETVSAGSGRKKMCRELETETIDSLGVLESSPPLSRFGDTENVRTHKRIFSRVNWRTRRLINLRWPWRIRIGLNP